MITWKYFPSTMMGPSALFPIFYNAFFNSTSPIPTSQDPPQPSISAGNYDQPMYQEQQQQQILGGDRRVSYIPLASIAQDQWVALNTSVGGRLHGDGVPFSRPCFDSYELQFKGENETVENEASPEQNTPSEECQARQKGYLSETYRLGHFGSATNVCPLTFYEGFILMPHIGHSLQPQWETCQATSQGCLLDWMKPVNDSAFSAPRICHQGSVSKYYVSLPCPPQLSSFDRF
jgi:hypothetical protein